MKKQILRFAAWLMLFSLASCMYDEADFNDRLTKLEDRVKTLEDLCSQINNDMSALQTIVKALQNHITITEVQQQANGYSIFFSNGKNIQINNGAKGEAGKDGTNGKDGYTPTIGAAMDSDGFYCWTVDGSWLLDADGNRIHVTGDKGADGKDGIDGNDGADGKDGTSYNVGMKKDADGFYYWTINDEWLLDSGGNKVRVTGNDGKDGADGVSYVLNIKQDTDGYYYWTLNGEWLLDGSGNKIRVTGNDGKDGTNGRDGVSPKLKIDNDYWYISYDNGTTWTQLGYARGADGTNGTNGKDGVDAVFHSVTQDENNVYFTLADGVTVITIPKTKVESLVERIKSVSYIPQYSDGWATIYYTPTKNDGIISIDFLFSPKNLLSEIQHNWKSLLTFKAIYTETRSSSHTELVIKKVSSNTEVGVLTITVSCSNLDNEFYQGQKNAIAYLTIKDTSSEICSDFVPLSIVESSFDVAANGHEYVDFGLPLGNLWATCNIGADTPQDSGLFLAWGETTEKEDYSWETLKYYSTSDNTFSKYCTNSEYGNVDNKKELESIDDAAAILWGGGWKVPSREDWQELIDNCEWVGSSTSPTISGQSGKLYGFYVKRNGKTIFLQTLGYKEGTEWKNIEYGGYYWSSSIVESDNYQCHKLLLSPGYKGYDARVYPAGAGIGQGGSRQLGYNIRPVCKR